LSAETPQIIPEAEKDLHYGSESGILHTGTVIGGGAEDLQNGAENAMLNAVVADMRRIDGEHTIQDDLKAVNDAAKHEYNCGNCAFAYELRRRGFDVEAMPRMGMMSREWLEMFEGFKPLMPESGDAGGLIEELAGEISAWGAGARGTVIGRFNSRNGRGHIFSFEVDVGGKVMFVDAQNNAYNAAGYFFAMDPSSIRYGRLDNLRPSADIRRVVRNRGMI
jgi:hypothetical protein